MRILNETDAFMEAKERYRFEGTKRYDIEKLDAFLDGFEFADNQIKPMFLLFAEWLAFNATCVTHANGEIQWCLKGASKDEKTTTELFELFELFLVEQTKK